MKNITDTVLKYDAIFEEAEEGGFTVSVPSLPGCISEGDTFEFYFRFNYFSRK